MEVYFILYHHKLKVKGIKTKINFFKLNFKILTCNKYGIHMYEGCSEVFFFLIDRF